jgi:ABC-type xylose transport system substrate-binding protein
MKQAVRVVGLAFVLATSVAAARSSVPVVDYDKVAVVSSQGMTQDAARRAIVSAGVNQRYPWVVVGESAGKLTLQSVVRGKHTLVVDVTYDTKAFSIKYAGSTNMNAEVLDGVQLIHPNYNKWVQQLMQSISVAFAKHM